MTQLFLTNDNLPGGATGEKMLSLKRGVASATCVTNTATSTGFPCTLTAGGAAISWWMQIEAVSSLGSGNWTANVRGLESNLSANCGAGIQVQLYAADRTTVIGDILSDKTIPATITEYTTSDSAKALAAVAGTSRNATQGQWIKVTLKVRNVGTMAAGFTVTNSFSGATAAAVGDTSVTCAETVVPYSPLFDASSVAAGATGQGPLDWTHSIGPQATLLIGCVGFGANSVSGETCSLILDPAGANQAFTAIGSPVTTGTAGALQLFKLRKSVTSFATGNKTIRAATSGGGGSSTSINAMVFSFATPADDLGTAVNIQPGGTPANASGNLTETVDDDPCVAFFCAGNAFTGQNWRLLQAQSVDNLSGGGNLTGGIGGGRAGTVPFRATLLSADNIAGILAEVLRASGAPPAFSAWGLPL